MTTQLSSVEIADIDKRFETFDPSTATTFETDDTLPDDLVLVQAQAKAIYLRHQADTILRAAVATARDHKMSWHKIGVALGTTGEAARQKYAPGR